MFDDKKPPVEDMFSGTEGEVVPQQATAMPPKPLLTPPPAAPNAGIPQPSRPQAPTAPAPATALAELPAAPLHSGSGILKVMLIVIVILVLVGGAAYAAYKVMMRQPADDGILDSVSDDGVVGGTDDATEADTPTATDDAAIDDQDEEDENRGTFLDSDGDGLTNAEELDAGTSINKADTDSDGLGDREEVEVYETDPSAADTDGDTYLDGQEVAGGYNPNGEGRLFTVPSN